MTQLWSTPHLIAQYLPNKIMTGQWTKSNEKWWQETIKDLTQIKKQPVYFFFIMNKTFVLSFFQEIMNNKLETWFVEFYLLMMSCFHWSAPSMNPEKIYTYQIINQTSCNFLAAEKMRSPILYILDQILCIPQMIILDCNHDILGCVAFKRLF